MKQFFPHRGFTSCFFAFLLFMAAPAWSESPTAPIRAGVDQAVRILSDPGLQGDARKGERRKLLRQAIFPHFDFREMAKRSLGAHWRRRTPEEQAEFVTIFTDLLERAYTGRIESYNHEKFVYLAEKIDGNYAEVQSEIETSKGEKFKLDYKLHQVADKWKIYDVLVEDISLVNNYRSQFNRVINNSSYQELVSRMKRKMLQAANG